MAELTEGVELPLFTRQFLNITKLKLSFAIQKGLGLANR